MLDRSGSRLPIALTVGLAAFFVGALQYRSYESRVVLDRWSPAYLLVLAGLFLTLVLGWSWVVRARRCSHSPSRTVDLRRRVTDLAAMAGGLGYLRAAMQTSEAGGSFLELNLLGSADPLAAFLQWLVMPLLLAASGLLILDLRPERLQRIALALAGIVLVLVSAEGFLRFRSAWHPSTQGFPTYTTEAWQARYVRLNSEGFRDRELAREPDDSVSRILIVGDSTAFGFGLDRLEERFGEQIAKRLSERSGRRYESITAALPNSHTLHHIEFLRRGLRYRPEVVVLLYGLNDIDYLVNVTDRDEWGIRVLRRGLHPAGVAFRNLYLFQEISARLRHFSWERVRRSDGEDPLISEDIVARHLEDVALFASQAREQACVVAVAPHGWLAQGSDFVRRQYVSFIEQAVAADVPVWSMLEAFEGEVYDSLIVNTLDHHPNRRANEIAAVEVAERVLEELDGASQCLRSLRSRWGADAAAQPSLHGSTPRGVSPEAALQTMSEECS